MRPEIKEYDFDWMIASLLGTGARMGNATDSEWKRAQRFIPYFSGLLEPLLNTGDTGKLFLNLLTQSLEELINAKKIGQKVVMTTFCMNTAIFHAMDIKPVMPEVLTALSSLLFRRGAVDYMDHCVEVGFPDTGCSSQRGGMGAYFAGLGVDIDFIAVNMSGICDNNATAYAFASEYLRVPYYSLNYPSSLTDDETRLYHREDFKALIKFLEEQTGKKLDIDRLREILEEQKKQDEIISEIEDLMRQIPSPMPGPFHLIVYVSRWLFGGLPTYTELLKNMLSAVRKNSEDGTCGLSSGVEKLRAFFFYIDNYAMNLRMWDWFDRHGISILGSILSRNFPDNAPYLKDKECAYSIDTKDLDSMIESLAEMNARNPMARTIRGPYDAPYMWLEDSLFLSSMYKADCCIYSATPGCRNTWSNVKLMARDIEKAGYPVHIVNSDGFDNRVESWEKTEEQLYEFFTVRGLL